MRKRGFALATNSMQSNKPILEEIERIRAEAGLDEKEAAVNKVGGIGAEALVSIREIEDECFSFHCTGNHNRLARSNRCREPLFPFL